jgi:predicted GNAT family acetyltransferase
MRTAPFAPYPPYLLEMPADAALELARTLHERGEQVDAVNGALPAARTCAEELASLSGRRVEVVEHLRLFELGELRAPASRPPGHLRTATRDDVALTLAWYTAFGADAAAQAGRTEPHSMVHDDEASMLQRIEDGRVHLWCLPDGTPVHVTGDNPPSFGVARVGPVYTPHERRGQGYASAAVHEVSRRIRAAGARACLFTDQANPTSNALYQRLGYEPVEDQVNQVLV